MSGILSIVATPIGNLEDTGFRAIRILKEADIIACEDTRVTSKLLNHYEIKGKKLISLHQHTTQTKLSSIINDVENGKKVAYASDAGTPNVNDPGGKLMELAYVSDIKVEVIPGPSALTAAISACGFAMEHFSYSGFIPVKKRRKVILKEIVDREEPTIFFESTHRISKTLKELQDLIDEKRIIYVGRELTKKFETHLRGTMTEVIQKLGKGSSKGEFVIVIGPKP
jgi:16S rRNA (cytidine1402-2'-O)-methyltransferase